MVPCTRTMPVLSPLFASLIPFLYNGETASFWVVAAGASEAEAVAAGVFSFVEVPASPHANKVAPIIKIAANEIIFIGCGVLLQI